VNITESVRDIFY